MAILFFSLIFFCLIPFSVSQIPFPRGTLINCGANEPSIIDGRQWSTDQDFITQGTSKNLSIPVLVPIISTVRSFPFKNNLNHKFCYVVPVFSGARYMVRTTYFYGGINGNSAPPVFDQMVDGTLWSVVNTTEDYSNGMSSYYEGVFLAQGKSMSFCLGVNSDTDSDPFISALEFLILGNSLYNSTNFNESGLSLVARHSFGHNRSIIRYPDDEFDRFWEPYGAQDPNPSQNKNVSVSGIWNLPPLKVFETELMATETGPMDLKWPLEQLENSMYYIALYFADDRDSSTPKRFLNVSVNGVAYYKNLSLSQEGSVVFATQWPLTGLTTITLAPTAGSDFRPFINAGEVFKVTPLGGRTLARDALALEHIKSNLQNPPEDWSGDPCMPHQYSWTGVTCVIERRIRIVALNLTNMGLSGSLSPSLARLTALTDIWLGNNSLSGPIPDLSSLRVLRTLHLEKNQFSGEIPASFANSTNLKELFLQNNNLTGQIPVGLATKPGLDLRTSGNQFTLPPSS